MTLNIYTIYDSKADSTIGGLITAENDATMKRNLSMQLAQNPRQYGPIAAYPDDFYIYKLGLFENEKTGLIAAADPVRVCCVAELIQKGD